MAKKLAIIGASYLQLPLVEKAKEMGLEIHCFAWVQDAVCVDIVDYFYPISTTDKEQIYKVCREVGIDGVCTISSDIAVPTVNYIAERMGLIGNSSLSSPLCTNKYLMRSCFVNNEIASPAFVRIQKNSDISSCKSMPYPLIVKPTDRSGSRGVMKVYNDQELTEAIEKAWEYSFSKEAIVEEFIEGQEVSVEAISYQGKHYILQITDKVTTGPPHFVELEHHQPSQLPNYLQEQIKSMIPRALDCLGIKFGASHSELKITQSGDIKIIEIGARMGGDFIGSDLVRLSTGYDFLAGVIQVALGEFQKPIENICSQFSGVYFLSKETTDYVFPIIKNMVNIPEVIKAEVTSEHLSFIESSADRSGYFIYQSKKGKYDARRE